VLLTSNHNQMTPARWPRVKELFESALERARDERLAFVDQASDGDEPLRSEVESLLAPLMKMKTS
jgi:hypothetical protein